MVLPVSIVLSNLLNFVIALPVLFLLAWLSGAPLSGQHWLVIWLPVILLVQMVFSVGIGLILATANVFYRDVQIIMEVIMLAWFFLTPIIYPISRVPESVSLLGATIDLQRTVYILNPMASIIATYRDVLYYGRFIGADFFLRTAVTALIVLLLGYLIFQHYAGRFAEEI
jgi:ABC-type polysaccharide/polyol phosphate export permease